MPVTGQDELDPDNQPTAWRSKKNLSIKPSKVDELKIQQDMVIRLTRVTTYHNLEIGKYMTSAVYGRHMDSHTSSANSLNLIFLGKGVPILPYPLSHWKRSATPSQKSEAVHKGQIPLSSRERPWASKQRL